MKDLLNEFIAYCNFAKITPAEKEIDFFLLRSNKANEYREFLIRFCFFYWDKRNNKSFIERLFEYNYLDYENIK